MSDKLSKATDSGTHGKDNVRTIKPGKHHLIRPTWLRRTLKTIFGVLLFILLLPIMIYIPFIQDGLKDTACGFASEATGMTIRIDKFRLKFPLDVKFDGVLVLTEKGDTMIQARSLIADVKILPLLKMDAQINRVNLLDGKYNMVSEDSSLTMRIKAGNLRFDGGSNLDLKNSHISLRNPVLKDADVVLNMDVWKKKPDSISTPTQWIITVDRMQLTNVGFHMSMLPTIKTLDLNIGKGSLSGASIDLKNNNIRISSFDCDNSSASYITPTAGYIATHPAPVDTISPPSPPMTISLGKVHLGFDHALYATDSIKPAAGFDPSYIEVTDADIYAHDFFNRASELRLPILSLQAKERSGLQVKSASGTLAIDSVGLALQHFNVTTANSNLTAEADLSFKAMSMDLNAPIDIDASGSLGRADIYAFMPSLKPILSRLYNNNPVTFTIDASGSVSSLKLRSLQLAIKNLLSLKASGSIKQPTDPKQVFASVDLTGSLQDPRVVSRLMAKPLAAIGIHIPSFTIKGHVGIDKQNYTADIDMKSSAGDAAMSGRLSLNAEKYEIDANLSNLNLNVIMPSLGIGTLTGHISADGAGFNPVAPHASTNAEAQMKTLVYNGHNMAPFTLSALKDSKGFHVDLNGHNPDLDLDLTADGTINGNEYAGNIDADMRHVDLSKLGFINTACYGSGKLALAGNANISTLICNLDMSLTSLDWQYDSTHYLLPHAFDAKLTSTTSTTDMGIYASGTDLDIHAESPLKQLISELPKAFDLIMKQVNERNLDMAAISDALPSFCLNLNANGDGLASELMGGSDISFQDLSLSLSNDSIISGNIQLLQGGNKSLTIDTLSLGLTQRGKMLDYKLHAGNTPKNMPEFADVNISGYLGSNRASAYIRQRNTKGETGYRLGFTAAMMDSTVSIHLTPLDATIAYKPWVINDANYIQIGPGQRVEADLQASSGLSSVALKTAERTDGQQALNIGIKDLHIEDFLQMNVFAPPVTGTVNSDLTLVYHGKSVTGNGTVGVHNLSYNKTRIGNLDLDVKAGMGFTGNSGARIGLRLNGKEVMIANGYMITDSIAAAQRADGNPTALNVELKEFPLSVANPFLPAEYMQLSGELNGNVKVTGSFASPAINGTLTCDSVGIRIPMASTTLSLDPNTPIVVTDNILNFKDFRIHGPGENPFTLNGSVDAHNISNIAFNLSMQGSDVALVNNTRARSDIYGKLFVNLDASAKGNMEKMDIDANLSVLPATDVFYTLSDAAAQIQGSSTTDVVKFVQFSDTTAQASTDSIKSASMAMRINASLNIISGAKATVNLSAGGTNKVQLSPSGSLTYTQNYMGDNRLNGTLFLGSGMARYSVPMIGEKTFNFDDGSYVNWTGDLMNPALHINATDRVKANVQQEGMNSRLIYFDVGLSVLGTLSAPKVTFDLSTQDDMTVQNELMSMSPEQRSASAINLLLYNTYTGPGVKANANLSNPLYSFLEGQLNSWAAKNIRGVDLSFGIDQYKQTIDGENDNTTSYSYQVSKSLFDNRFKIIVGGNYSTDAQVDENFTQNLISDISFEYSLKQTQTMNMYLRLFRHTGFESILEGEVTETGVGFVMRRKISNLRSLFRFKRRKKLPEPVSDTTVPQVSPALVPLSNDSIIHDETNIEK